MRNAVIVFGCVFAAVTVPLTLGGCLSYPLLALFLPSLAASLIATAIAIVCGFLGMVVLFNWVYSAPVDGELLDD
jgi:hypothetical protein